MVALVRMMVGREQSAGGMAPPDASAKVEAEPSAAT
jgi:hypothetical protein